VQILVMGVDARSSVDGERTDTMMLVRVADGETRILSIPRDTLVQMEGHGDSKINSAYTYGGTDLAQQVVGRLTGLPVDYYVKIDLSGFRHLIDLMGGVWFDVPKRMSYVDPTDNFVVDLQPGRQLLDGAKAEQLVRFRHDEIGDDMGRIARQQEFLKAAALQALTPSNLPRLPQLLYTARQYVQTDIPLTRQLGLAQALFRAEQHGAVVQETVPGKGDYVDGISFFVVDHPELNRLVTTWQAPDNGR
jgi:LCP family protein required for cell wall assembly